jgi:hypothetical protein
VRGVGTHDLPDIEKAFVEFQHWHPDALVVLTSGSSILPAARIVDLANKSRLPTIHGARRSKPLVRYWVMVRTSWINPDKPPSSATVLPMLLLGVRVNTSPTDDFPLKQMQLMHFDGKRWGRFGEVIGN